MKRLLIFAVALLALVACTKDNNNITGVDNPPVIEDTTNTKLIKEYIPQEEVPTYAGKPFAVFYGKKTTTYSFFSGQNGVDSIIVARTPEIPLSIQIYKTDTEGKAYLFLNDTDGKGAVLKSVIIWKRVPKDYQE